MASANKEDFVRNHLTSQLKKLDDAQFQKFKAVLHKTSMRELVRAGDEYEDKPNVFDDAVSVKDTVDKLIGTFGRTYALTAAATVMEKIKKRNLAQDLQREAEALQVTEHGLGKKSKSPPREIAEGLVIGVAGIGVAVAAPVFSLFALPAAFYGGFKIVNGIRFFFTRK